MLRKRGADAGPRASWAFNTGDLSPNSPTDGRFRYECLAAIAHIDHMAVGTKAQFSSHLSFTADADLIPAIKLAPEHELGTPETARAGDKDSLTAAEFDAQLALTASPGMS